MVFVGALLTGAPGQTRTLHLQFDYPATESTNVIGFNIYASTNAAGPIAAWPILTNVPAAGTAIATNAGFLTFDVPLAAASKAMFYSVTASNSVAESPPSPIVAAPYPPPAPPALRIQ